MKDEQIKILTIMSQATNRMDLNMFAQKVNLSTNEIMAGIQELTKMGFLRKVGSGYGVTEKGKAALKAIAPLASDLAFNFYLQIGQSTGQCAQSILEFYTTVKEVSAESLEFHLYRGDFERWLTEAVKDPELAKDVATIKSANLNGEELRKGLLQVIEAKYDAEEL